MERFDKAFALGEVEALLRQDQPTLILKGVTHYGEIGFAYVTLFGADSDQVGTILQRAEDELAARGFPVEPIPGKDVMDVRPIPPEGADR